jgi:hypothetical protein
MQVLAVEEFRYIGCCVLPCASVRLQPARCAATTLPSVIRQTTHDSFSRLNVSSLWCFSASFPKNKGSWYSRAEVDAIPRVHALGNHGLTETSNSSLLRGRPVETTNKLFLTDSLILRLVALLPGFVRLSRRLKSNWWRTATTKTVVCFQARSAT